MSGFKRCIKVKLVRFSNGLDLWRKGDGDIKDDLRFMVGGIYGIVVFLLSWKILGEE